MKVEFNTEKNFEETKKALFDAFPDCTSVIFDEKKQEPSKWISVEDRLPEETETVIVYDTDVHCAWYDCDEGCFVDETFWYGDVTHWMPLPQPPKENENG